MSYSPDERQQQGGTLGALWPAATQPPPEDFNVLLAFHGLFCFCHNEEVCEVGVHRLAPDHEFGVFVLEFDPAVDSPIRLVYPPEGQDGVPKGPIRLSVERPRIPGVSYFQSDSESESDFENDWRRLPDFEGPLFYDTKVEKKREAFDPIITIEQGLFYTFSATDHEFERVAEGDENDAAHLGQVSYFVGADLTHEAGGRVSLKIGDEQPVVLEATGEKKYLILFANSCPPEKEKCQFDPHSPDKEKRNDFHFYYKTFKIPGNKPEYLLKLKGTSRGGDASTKSVGAASFLNFFSLEVLSKFAPLSNHEAPCGSSGYGRGGGLGG